MQKLHGDKSFVCPPRSNNFAMDNYRNFTRSFEKSPKKEIGEAKINSKFDLRAQKSHIEKLAKENLVMQVIENDGRNEKLHQKSTTFGTVSNISADLT